MTLVNFDLMHFFLASSKASKRTRFTGGYRSLSWINWFNGVLSDFHAVDLYFQGVHWIPKKWQDCIISWHRIFILIWFDMILGQWYFLYQWLCDVEVKIIQPYYFFTQRLLLLLVKTNQIYLFYITQWCKETATFRRLKREFLNMDVVLW